MNQQELFEYIKKQYPATPERITQNGKQITIFKNQRNNIPYAIFYQSDESVMSIMEVQAESDMISNYIEMYHLAPAKYMNQKHWLAVPMDGTVRDSKVLDMLDMGYDIVDEQEKMTEKQEMDSRIEEIKWDDKSKFKEAKYNEKSYYYDDCGICFSCLAVQRCVAALVWHHWRWSPRILYLSDLWWNYSSFRYYSRLY